MSASPDTIERTEEEVVIDVDVDTALESFFKNEDLWSVIVLDDDVTTWETVIFALMQIFGYDERRAFKLAEQVDREGQALVASRPKEEAEAAVVALHTYKIQAKCEKV